MNRRLIFGRLDHLRGVLDEISRIEVGRAEDLEDRANFQARRALERCLFLAIQDLLDIGSHIIAAHSLGMPETYQDIIDILGREGILPGEFAARIRGMAGFRNILEHEYVRLDMDKVVEYAGRRCDFEEFARHVVEFLERCDAKGEGPC